MSVDSLWTAKHHDHCGLIRLPKHACAVIVTLCSRDLLLKDPLNLSLSYDLLLKDPLNLSISYTMLMRQIPWVGL